MDNYSNLEEENKKLKAQLENLERNKKEKWSKRYQFSKKLSAKFLGAKLKNAINNFFTELQEKKTVSRDTVSDLLAALFIRITRVGVFLLITSLLPTLLILLQVYYLKGQNRLITGQNERMKQQTFLQEANRRSFTIGIVDQMVKEVTAPGGLTGSKLATNRTRLIAISKILKPYRYLDGDRLIEKPVSPERGYLLLSLLESSIPSTILNQKIDGITDERFMSAINFSYAEMKNASVTEKNLKDIHLDFSNLEGSNFMKSQFTGTRAGIKTNGNKIENLYNKCSFTHAYLRSVIFDFCDFTRCDFSNGDMLGTSFARSTLINVNFSNANLENTNFNGSELTNVNFTNANILNSNFDNAVVSPNFLETMEAQLPSESYEYLESTYDFKISKKKGILIRKK